MHKAINENSLDSSVIVLVLWVKKVDPGISIHLLLTLILELQQSSAKRVLSPDI